MESFETGQKPRYRALKMVVTKFDPLRWLSPKTHFFFIYHQNPFFSDLGMLHLAKQCLERYQQAHPDQDPSLTR